MIRKTLLALSVFLSFHTLYSQTITLNLFASGFSSPSDIAFAPGDNRMYLVQQRGRVRIVNTNGTIVPTDFINMSSLVSQSGNERGLLGLAFDPDYVNNGYFYVNYTRSSGGNTRISRFSRSTTNPDSALLSSEVVLLEVTQPFSNHNGGCLKFGSDGYLYIGLGDGGSGGDPGNRAQNPLNLLGKMLRIDVNAPTYTVPLSNPYYGQTDTLPEIWSLGLRNPWRFSFDKLLGDLWIGDVGQDAYEEVDYQSVSSTGGENYGWRCYEGLHAFNTASCQPQSFYTDPVAEYSQGSSNCAVTGGFVYRGAAEGDLYGKYLYIDYCSGIFRVVTPNGSGGWTASTLNTVSQNIVTFGENHEGDLYCADGFTGEVFRISTPPCQPTASVYGANGSTAICGPGGSLQLSTPAGSGLTYQWLLNSSPIGGATNNTYTATAGGNYQVVVTNSSNCTATSTVFAVTVASLPTVTLGGDTAACLSETSSSLSGLPVGGIYTGTGAGNGVFYPNIAGAGLHDVVYTYTDGVGCSNSDTLTVNVHGLPAVTASSSTTTFCINDPTATISGTPSGGTFSGPGMTGSTFDPLSAGAGTHNVVYSYTDGFGCSNSDTLAVTVLTCSGIDENQNVQQLSIYPNPARHLVNLHVNAIMAGDAQVLITGVDGKVLRTLQVQLQQGENTFPITLDGLAAGIYQVQLLNGQKWVRPLIITE